MFAFAPGLLGMLAFSDRQGEGVDRNSIARNPLSPKHFSLYDFETCCSILLMTHPSPLPTFEANGLLAAMAAETRDRLARDLELVELPLGLVLAESHQPIEYAYFPTSALVSLLYVMDTGDAGEVAVIGREGMVGVSLFMSGSSSINRIVVQSKGHGFRLRAQALQEEFQRAGQAMNVLLRFTQALMAQMAQTAVCNRHHSLDQQLCRWLLLSMDRLPSDQLVMTQELISQMLGVRRESVTEAANRLRRSGLIRYARGHIEVLDRAGLETRACECYAVVRKEYERLMPSPT